MDQGEEKRDRGRHGGRKVALGEEGPAGGTVDERLL